MLSRQEFTTFAEAERPEDVDAALWSSAIRVTLAARRDEGFGRAEVATVREVADALGAKEAAGPRPVPLEATALTDADGAKMMAVVDPAIHHAREQAFGSPRPPFRSVDRAMSWLRKSTAGGVLVAIRAEERGRRAVETARQQGFRMEVWATGPRLRWSDDSTGEVLSFRPTTQEALYLAHTIRNLSEATGFAEPDLLRYALFGGDAPRLLRATVHPRTEIHTVNLPDGRSFGIIQRSEVVVHLLAPDISEADLRAVVREARTELAGGAHRRPTLTERDLDLAKLVEAAPEWADEEGTRWSVAVWEKIAQRWKKQSGKKVGARALLARYRRLLEKRERMGSGATVIAEESLCEPWRNDG